MAFFFGFFVSGAVFWVTMTLFPPPGMREFDDVDYFAAFTAREAERLGVVRLDATSSLEGVDGMVPMGENEKGPKMEYVVADGAY